MNREKRKATPQQLAQLAMLTGKIPDPPARVLITGGAGYIGAHVCREMLNDGHDVCVLDDLTAGSRIDRRAATIVGDMCDPAQLATALQIHRPDVVLHLGGPCDARESLNNPAAYYDSHINAALLLAEAGHIEQWGRRVVFASSCSVYGDAGEAADEATPMAPASPYGAAKVAAEEILNAAVADDVLRGVVALRLFNVAGSTREQGEQRPALGDDRPRRIIPAICRTAIEGGPMHIFDGGHAAIVRDFVHVADVAEAFIAAARRMVAGAFDEYRPFNIGGGPANATDLRRLVNIMATVAGRDIEIITEERNTADPLAIVADASAAGPALNWKPRRDLEAIAISAWEYANR